MFSNVQEENELAKSLDIQTALNAFALILVVYGVIQEKNHKRHCFPSHSS